MESNGMQGAALGTNTFNHLNVKLQSTEMLYNTEIKGIIDALPEPWHTYLLRVKQFQAKHPVADISGYSKPKEITGDINKTRLRLMQLKIGGLKEEYGFSSGVKFDLGIIVQAIASGRGLSSRDKPFIRLTSDITHSVTILIDCSTSMEKYMKSIKESVHVFCEVLNGLQLSFTLLGYGEQFWIVKDFAEKWDLEAKARLSSLEARGMAPESIAIKVAGNVSRNAIEKGKVMFVITDGIFENRIHAKRSVQAVRKDGIVIIGVSVLAQIGDVFPVNIVERDDLNSIWARDALMRIYSREFQSDY
ncbi:VWA domain-containing protein [Candidatus Bathyarchaeota archaeon]|nr:VWA domain-containing protein [Candidatus Bathyarchaeota archaeon]